MCDLSIKKIPLWSTFPQWCEIHPVPSKIQRYELEKSENTHNNVTCELATQHFTCSEN